MAFLDILRRRGPRARARPPQAPTIRPQAPLRLVLDHFPGLVAFVDQHLVLRLVSRGYAEWYQREVSELEGLRIDEVVDPATFAKMRPRIRAVLEGEPQTFLRPDEPAPGHQGWRLQTTFVPVRGAGGDIEGFFTFSVDVGHRLDAESALRRERERALVTLESIADAVITVDPAGAIDYMNPVAQSLTGWDATLARGRPVREVFLVGDEQRGEPVENPAERCLAEGTAVTLMGEHVLCARDGGLHAVDVSVAPIAVDGRDLQGAVLVFRDVGTARQLSQDLAWQAEHDALTALPNRRRFERCVELAIESSRQHGEEHAVMFLDLDQFKVVNDTCGHAAGDRLLREIALLLGPLLRSSDVLARLGGDEFGVLLRQCPIARAAQAAERMRSVLEAHRFAAEGKTFAVGGSFGLVAVTAESQSLAEVMRAADSACYLAKERGRNRVHLAASDEAAIRRRQDEMEWVGRVRAALEENRFELYGQPIMPLRAELGPKLEVLIRMRDERGEMVPPMAWIPSAERYGVMPEIDRWVVKTAFHHLAHRPASDRTVYAINLSGTTLSDPAFLDFVRFELSMRSVDPASVCFEITETAAIANLERAQAFMAALRGVGVHFALDDFGAGMSSFAYLKALPVDYLKIDGGFVRRMAIDPVDHAMVEAINNLGHVMRIGIVAEFVENDEVLERLRRLGVDYAQGHGIGVPRPLAEFSRAAHPAPPERPQVPVRVPDVHGKGRRLAAPH